MSEVVFCSHHSEVLKAFDPISNRRGWSDHIAIEGPAGEPFDMSGYRAEMEIADPLGAACLAGSTESGALKSIEGGLAISFDASAMGALRAGSYLATIRILDKNGLINIDPTVAPLLIVEEREA